MADYLLFNLSLTLIRMPTVKQSQEDILANSIENLDVTEEVEDMEESWNKDQIQDLITLSGLFCLFIPLLWDLASRLRYKFDHIVFCLFCLSFSAYLFGCLSYCFGI